MPEKKIISLNSAKGTIYFKNSPEGLLQGYDLSVDNQGAETEGDLKVKWSTGEYKIKIDKIPAGESVVRVYVPDIRDNVKMVFSLNGAELKVDHHPQRHWTVHLVQFAHHDLGYTDIPSNIFNEYLDMYDDVLRYCSETDHFPDESKFRYTIEQGWSLLYYLDHRSEDKRQEMIRRIKEGRIEVNAFLANETSELLGPEEMIRMLYPVFALKRKYGIPVKTAEHNDIPGISWGVAAAMAGAGIEYFAPALPDYFYWAHRYHTFWDEETVAPNNIPHAFKWEAPTGKKILFWYGRQGAGGQVDVTLSDLPQYLEQIQESGYPYDLLRYIVMGGWRDNSVARVEFAYTCKDWNEKWAYPRYVFSLNSRFFPELEKQLPEDIPTYRGELPGTDYPVTANCTAYPSSLNRTTHDMLLSAERIAAIASDLTPYKYPAHTIEEAYYCTLLNDEHAWGMAHPTGPAHEACIAQHCEFAYRATALSQDVLVKAVHEIADHVTRKDDGYYAFIFNPLNWTRTDIATAPAHTMEPCGRPMVPIKEGKDWGDRPARLHSVPVSDHAVVPIPMNMIYEGMKVIDMSTGKTVPHEIYEVTDPQAPIPYAAYRWSMGHFRPQEKFEVRFLAEDVPAMGYKLFKFVPARKTNPKGGVTVGRNTLENRFYKVELDPKTGAIVSIYDKDLKRELVDPKAGYGANQVVIRSSLTSETSTNGKAKISRGRNGALSGSLIVKTDAPGYPQITQEIVLYSDIKRIDIGNKMLKDSTAMLETFFAFPFDFNEPKFKYEGSLSTIEPLKDQFPGSNTEYYTIQHWANVSDSKNGVTISSLDAPMMQFGGNWPLYISQAHHGFTPPNFDHPFHTEKDVKKGHMYSLVLLNNYTTNFSPTQNGEVLFRYSITSHEGDWKAGRAPEFGYNISLPFVHAGLNGKHEGELSNSSSFVQIDKDNVVLLTLKRAEDGQGFIVRLMETLGEDTEVTVTLPFLAIKTAYETNLVEENLRLARLTLNTVKVKVPAWGTATVRVVQQ